MPDNYSAADAELDAQAADVLASLDANTKSLTHGSVVDKLCATWSQIRPFVVAAVKYIPLPNIRRAVEVLINLLDGLCPS